MYTKQGENSQTHQYRHTVQQSNGNFAHNFAMLVAIMAFSELRNLAFNVHLFHLWLILSFLTSATGIHQSRAHIASHACTCTGDEWQHLFSESFRVFISCFSRFIPAYFFLLPTCVSCAEKLNFLLFVTLHGSNNNLTCSLSPRPNFHFLASLVKDLC